MEMKATQLILLFSIGVLIIPGSTGWMFRRKKSSSSSEESGESKTNSGSYESESDEEDQNDGYQDPTKEVDKSCLGLGTNGTCMFYNCFDERWPCPETDNYAIEYGLEICERFDKYYDDFSTEGKKWIMDTRKCVLEQMLRYYTVDSLKCTDIKMAMFDKLTDCTHRHGGCDVSMLMDNKEVLSKIYTDSFSLNALRSLLSVTTKCGGDNARGFQRWIQENLSICKGGVIQNLIGGLLDILGVDDMSPCTD